MWCYFVILVLVALLVVASYFAIRFGIIILNVQDALEESLDLLDEQYSSMSTVLNTPLFYDSPEIRKVLNGIDGARTSILKVAKILTEIDNPNTIDDDAVPEIEETNAEKD
tara:strand:- start:151 stop:483 length:333 start_codon:yes stop_codon:yes gene_type:complete